MVTKTGSLIFIGTLLFNFSPARAWQEVRNGGDALVCVNYDPTGFQFRNTVYMYDYFEMFSRYRLKLAPPEWDIYYVPNRVASEFASRIPDAKSDVRDQAQALVESFYSEAQFQKAKLFDIRDAGQSYVPVDCKLEQLVLQAPPLGPEDPYYIINQILWEQMDEMQQAAAILHEVIYRMSPDDRKQFSSEKVRYLVALLISDSLKNKSSDEVDALFSDVGL